MSRKSSRLQAKHRETPTILLRKRKVEVESEKPLQISKRKQQFQIQNCWDVGSSSQSETSTIVPTSSTDSDSDDGFGLHRSVTPSDNIITSGKRFRFKNYFTTPVSERTSPLPALSWADPAEVWELMTTKELVYTRDSHMLQRHPSLQARMRAILLDWLIEVCEVYRLHRESYYLALDFIDRFLATENDVPKQQLQLIGITALFIASKLEEIYPPKLSEFAYVTDGACMDTEILDKELVILKALNWDLSPITVNAWLNVYLQVANLENISDTLDSFIYPHYSTAAFVRIAQLIDLCMLDIGCLQFTYSVIAASALYHMSSEHIAIRVSGFKWIDIASCVQWMTSFATTIRESGDADVKYIHQVMPEDLHNIQTHTIDLDLLERAQKRQEKIVSSSRSSPVATATPVNILTPPQSQEKGHEKKQHAKA